MSFLTNDQKGNLINLGANLILDELKHNRTVRENEFSNKQNPQKIAELESQVVEYETWFNNFATFDLNCKYKRTQDIFKSLTYLIMDNDHEDYVEVYRTLLEYIDNEKFIDAIDKAIEKRESRLDLEFENKMKDYESQMVEYNNQLEAHKKKDIFSKFFANKPEMPIKPERRS